MTMTMVDLRADSIVEADRLTRARAMCRPGDERALIALDSDATWIAVSRRGRLKRALAGRVCLAWRVAFADASGRLVESKIVPVVVEVCGVVGLAGAARRAWIRALIQDAAEGARMRVDAECDEWAREAARLADAFASARLAREKEIAGQPVARRPVSQPGLFDRRFQRQHESHAMTAAECEQEAVERQRTISTAGTITRVPARLLLVLMP